MPAGRFSDKIFPGARFGMLTVLERIPRKDKRRSMLRCSCECGTICALPADNISRYVSCGCQKKVRMRALAEARVSPDEGYSLVVPGARFYRLTVVERIRNGEYATSLVHCICDCGKETKSNIDGLVAGKTKSCGCLAKETTARRNRETAKFDSFSVEHRLTFQSWRSMLNRCYYPRQKAYAEYGAKGVVVCSFLRESPENLVAFIGHRPDDKPTLDRFPLRTGNYTCGQCEECLANCWQPNVRWASRKDQALNRKSNVYLEAFGKKMTLSQWAEASGMDPDTIQTRIKRGGWDVPRALTTPDKKGNFFDPEAESGTINV